MSRIPPGRPLRPLALPKSTYPLVTIRRLPNLLILFGLRHYAPADARRLSGLLSPLGSIPTAKVPAAEPTTPHAREKSWYGRLHSAARCRGDLFHLVAH